MILRLRTTRRNIEKPDHSPIKRFTLLDLLNAKRGML
jgi:hypothetical protein